MSVHIAGVNPKVYNGKKYRSTLEARTAETLDKMGLSWEYETKKITLQESFYCQYQKDKVRAITYTPDFIIGPVMIETKGFETPDWNIKKKLLYKYLTENDPSAAFYMIKNDKQLLQALDKHWNCLGYAVQATPIIPKRKKNLGLKPIGRFFDSIQQAFYELGLSEKNPTAVLKSLVGRKDNVYGYNWKIVKIKL